MMKLTKLSPPSLACLFALATHLTAQEAENTTAAALIHEHTVSGAAAVERYLADHPNAKDELEAVDYLIGAFAVLEDNAARAKYLQRKYDLIPKGADAEPPQFFEVFQELMAAHISNKDKSAGRKAMERARKDLAGHPEAEKYLPFVDQIGANLKRPDVGETMDFKFTSVQGEEVDIAAMRGKVVLIDFWATWCRPCISELPNIKTTYDRLNAKGFEVIGVSLDEEKSKKRLQGYIDEGEAPWPHAYDGKGWKSDLAQQFGIGSIPATFLLGKDGKIAAINLRGPALATAVRKELAKEE